MLYLSFSVGRVYSKAENSNSSNKKHLNICEILFELNLETPMYSISNFHTYYRSALGNNDNLCD